MTKTWVLSKQVRVLAVLIVGMVAMSGCVGKNSSSTNGKGAGKTSGGGGVTDTIQPTFGDDTGAILGEVLDDSNLPISDVTVRVREINDSVQLTTALGEFGYNNVAPGEYTLDFQKLGLESITKVFTILAGEPVKQQVTLKPIAIATPYSVVLGPMNGRFFCAWAVHTEQVGTPASPCKPISFTDPTNPVEQAWATASENENNIWELKDVVTGNMTSDKDSLAAIAIEFKWTATQAASTELQFAIEQYEEARSASAPVYAAGHGASVLKTVLVPDEVAKGGDAGVKLGNATSFGMGVWPYAENPPAAAYTDQDFQFYITLFYNGKMPAEDYTAWA